MSGGISILATATERPAGVMSTMPQPILNMSSMKWAKKRFECMEANVLAHQRPLRDHSFEQADAFTSKVEHLLQIVLGLDIPLPGLLHELLFGGAPLLLPHLLEHPLVCLLGVPILLWFSRGHHPVCCARVCFRNHA